MIELAYSGEIGESPGVGRVISWMSVEDLLLRLWSAHGGIVAIQMTQNRFHRRKMKKNLLKSPRLASEDTVGIQ